MKRSEVDYNKYDILDIYAKENKVETITECYESFCWELIEKNENRKYADTMELTFIRPHKLPQKDYLLYTQIEMENTLNAIGKLERTRYAKSTTISLICGLFSILLIILGGKFFSPKFLVVSIICMAIGIIGCILTTLMAIKLHKLDDERFNSEHLRLTQTLKDIREMVNKVVNDNANKD